jgi:Chaperone of endosialidase
LEVGLKEVTQLKPVTFEWKDDILISHPFHGKAIPRPLEPAMQGQQIGFIAQDVEKIVPSVVITENNTEKTKGMKYSEFIPVLVKAIQELKADNDNLRAQLTKDESTIAKDEASIASMKAKLGM